MNQEELVFILFCFIPITTLFFCFVRDSNRIRKRRFNKYLLINCAVFIAPLLMVMLGQSDSRMWSDNGSGAALWLYVWLFPLCNIAQLVLITFKIRFALQKPSEKWSFVKRETSKN